MLLLLQEEEDREQVHEENDSRTGRMRNRGGGARTEESRDGEGEAAESGREAGAGELGSRRQPVQEGWNGTGTTQGARCPRQGWLSYGLGWQRAGRKSEGPGGPRWGQCL